MNTCKTCRWWDSEHLRCHRQFVDVPTPAREFKTNTMRVNTIAFNGDLLDAMCVYCVFTGPDFGCVHWETSHKAEIIKHLSERTPLIDAMLEAVKREPNMKATLTPKTSYSVSIDGVEVGTFEAGTEWNGMLELRSGTYRKLIVEAQGDFPSVLSMLGNLNWNPTPREASVFKASPELLNDLKKALTAKAVVGNEGRDAFCPVKTKSGAQ